VARLPDLYTGGEACASRPVYLPKRQKEPAEVYYEAVPRVLRELRGIDHRLGTGDVVRTEPMLALDNLDKTNGNKADPQEAFYNSSSTIGDLGERTS